MEIQTHIAVQYLATANKSFVAPKTDDSHTNLGFDPKRMTLKTHPLSQNGTFLAFNYQDFSLEWNSPSGSNVLLLNGKYHKTVVLWLKERAKEILGLAYTFDLHYELPYTINDAYQFADKDQKELKRLADLRTLAQHSLETIVKEHKLVTDIRIWPHHFDTGGYAALPNTALHVGFGLAIPDSVCDDHYFYLSAYQDNGMVSTTGFKKLSRGTWVDGSFKGAILSAKDLNETAVIGFYNESIASFTHNRTV